MEAWRNGFSTLFTSEQLGEKMASKFASVTSEEIIQINFVGYIISLF